MNLIIEYFKSTNENRDKEYKACINENIKVSFIEKIFDFKWSEFEYQQYSAYYTP